MKQSTRRLCVTAMFLALATVLSLITVVKMPFGGAVTPASMLPICLLGLLYGNRWGLFSGLAYGLLQLFLGLDNLSYATSAAAAVAILLFDYLLAFAVLGLSGIFTRFMKNQTAASLLGVTLVCFLRFLCHFLTGVTVWRDMTKSVGDAVWYSIAYNGFYMLPEWLITSAALFLLLKFGVVERMKKM